MDAVQWRNWRAITADTALRLAKYFGTSAKLWLNLQANYELRRLKSGDWADTQKAYSAARRRLSRKY